MSTATVTTTARPTTVTVTGSGTTPVKHGSPAVIHPPTARVQQQETAAQQDLREVRRAQSQRRPLCVNRESNRVEAC
jgi:hypothetical protein